MKRITVVVSNLGVRVIRGDEGFYHNVMNENGVLIICGCGLSPEKYGMHVLIVKKALTRGSVHINTVSGLKAK